MLPKSTQIGGKGTMRRKKKRTGHFFKEKETRECREYKIKIKRLNELIENITDDDEYGKFKLYLDTEIEDIGLSINKEDLTKKTKKQDLEDLKEDCLSYVYSLLIYDIDRPIKFDPDAYNKLKKTFETEYLVLFITFIYELESGLEKKKYLEDIKEDNYEMEDIHKFFDLLDLDKSEIPTKEQIEKAYKLKALKHHPDKNLDKNSDNDFTDIKEAYEVLLRRYTKK